MTWVDVWFLIQDLQSAGCPAELHLQMGSSCQPHLETSHVQQLCSCACPALPWSEQPVPRCCPKPGPESRSNSSGHGSAGTHHRDRVFDQMQRWWWHSLHRAPLRGLPFQMHAWKKDVFMGTAPPLKPFQCLLGPWGQALASTLPWDAAPLELCWLVCVNSDQALSTARATSPHDN